MASVNNDVKFKRYLVRHYNKGDIQIYGISRNSRKQWLLYEERDISFRREYP